MRKLICKIKLFLLLSWRSKNPKLIWRFIFSKDFFQRNIQSSLGEVFLKRKNVSPEFVIGYLESLKKKEVLYHFEIDGKEGLYKIENYHVEPFVKNQDTELNLKMTFNQVSPIKHLEINGIIEADT